MYAGSAAGHAGCGLIVYLSSAAVQMPDVSGVAYQASKHGLSGLAHGTRVEEKAAGIRTCVIFPGLCETEILDQRPVPTPREVLDLALNPRDVAEAVAFAAAVVAAAVVVVAAAARAADTQAATEEAGTRLVGVAVVAAGDGDATAVF